MALISNHKSRIESNLPLKDNSLSKIVDKVFKDNNLKVYYYFFDK